MPTPGMIVDIAEYTRAFDEAGVSYWATGPALILAYDEYDVTFLMYGQVLYSDANNHVWDCLEV